MVAYPDCGAGNDPKLFLEVCGGWGGEGGRWEGGGVVFRSPPRLNIFYSGQYGSNDLPQPRKSALSECF